MTICAFHSLLSYTNGPKNSRICLAAFKTAEATIAIQDRTIIAYKQDIPHEHSYDLYPGQILLFKFIDNHDQFLNDTASVEVLHCYVKATNLQRCATIEFEDCWDKWDDKPEVC